MLELVVSTASGTVTGIATNTAGKPVPGARVVLMPATNRQRTHLFRAATADANGRYTIAGIAPGDYILAAWEAIEPFAFFDPERMREAETRGKPLRVRESSSQTIDVIAE